MVNRFQIDPSSFWSQCNFLIDIIDRASGYINHTVDGKNFFFHNIVLELALRVLKGQNKSEFSQEELLSENVRSQLIEKLIPPFNSKIVHLKIGDVVGPDPLMQASRLGNYVYIQPGWVGQAMMDFENSEFGSYYEVHVTLGVIKLLREFVYCLTPIILEAEYSLRRSRNPHAQQLEDTPITLGFTLVKKGERRKGDMGFAAEELISGGYRFYPRCHDSQIPYKFIGFHVYKLAEETLTGGKFIPFEVENEEDIIRGVVKNPNFDVMTEFNVRAQAKNPKKRKFTGSERKESAGKLHYSEDSEEDEEEWEKAFEGEKPYIVSSRNDNRVE